jgi:hypothetical protein
MVRASRPVTATGAVGRHAGEAHKRDMQPQSARDGAATLWRDGRALASLPTGTHPASSVTGAGANATATVFEHKDKQYVMLVSAGSALGGTTHGDSVWLFGLDGKLGPARAAGG